jgi:hypothetical protein
VLDSRDQVRRVLGRVAGRQEWGLRVRLDPALVRRRRPGLPPPAAKPRRAGTRFLLAKKQQRDVAREVLREGRAAVEDAFATLAGLADATQRRSETELDGTRVVLDAALLVPVRRLAGFRRAVERAIRHLATLGYRVSLTGPWPAYNFVR